MFIMHESVIRNSHLNLESRLQIGAAFVSNGTLLHKNLNPPSNFKKGICAQWRSNCMTMHIVSASILGARIIALNAILWLFAIVVMALMQFCAASFIRHNAFVECAMFFRCLPCFTCNLLNKSVFFASASPTTTHRRLVLRRWERFRSGAARIHPSLRFSIPTSISAFLDIVTTSSDCHYSLHFLPVHFKMDSWYFHRLCPRCLSIPVIYGLWVAGTFSLFRWKKKIFDHTNIGKDVILNSNQSRWRFHNEY